MLSLSRLRVLQEVVRCGSFSEAAETLSYTQSAVSQSIARLEDETGAPLLVRSRRGARATAAGATLAAHAETILAQVRVAEADVQAILGVKAGELHIASFPSAGATLIPVGVARFREQHPGVALTLAEAEPEEIAPRVRSGELDLALLFEFPGVGSRIGRELRTEQLFEDPMQVVLPARHRLAREPSVTLAELGGEDWVQTSASSPCARHVVRLCRRAGFDPNVTFETDDYETVQGLVAAGVGVALVPRLALTHLHSGIVVRQLAPRSPARTILAATAHTPTAMPAAERMLAVLRDVAAPYVER